MTVFDPSGFRKEVIVRQVVFEEKEYHPSGV